MSRLSTAEAAQADRFGVRKRREALGLTRSAFAQSARVSPGALRFVEYGYHGSVSLPRIERALDRLEAKANA